MMVQVDSRECSCFEMKYFLASDSVIVLIFSKNPNLIMCHPNQVSRIGMFANVCLEISCYMFLFSGKNSYTSQRKPPCFLAIKFITKAVFLEAIFNPLSLM